MIDILIVGAGPSGLCAAKTFLQYDPGAEIVLVDGYSTLGGVWSKQQLYPALKTNNLWSSLDWTDFPMGEEFGIKPGQHVTGEAMHAYLTAYADKFDVTRRIRFNTKVVEVRRSAGGVTWDVEVKENDGRPRILQCQKLVIATGILSVPHMPKLNGIEEFEAPFIHSSELGPRSDVFENQEIQNIAVLGGSKSAYDAVYESINSGHKVDWIIRKTGRGPVWVFPPFTMLGPFKAWRERLVTRRFFSFMSPSIFPDFSGFGWLKRFLHFNSIGKTISQNFWKLIKHDTINDCGYKTDKRFGILQPEQNPFWYGTASGTLSYETDFFDFVRNGQVRIHRQDIDHVSPHAINLADGTELPVDALIAATGFSAKPTISFAPTTSHSDLGLPTTELSKTQTSFWAEQDVDADLAIGSRFPRLLTGPFMQPGSSTPKPYHPGMAAEITYTPWRLYRGIAPPGLTAVDDRSLVFIGMFSNLANTIRLEIQCLWALAYMNGKLPNLSHDIAEGRVFAETALLQRFTQHRAPYGHGRFYPDLVFDQLPYWDQLLNDLGLETRRKGGLRELFEPYTQADYRGFVDDWVRANRQ
ncbi:putative dimethylaniline monooxygenase protein [Phaeoacremonium minimum UCRPA7]|uniref:Putative dimethylaniline monooxygenase protein n=1 Tax=Phaeoacremonium minimum (strain UCR-PA7) TaxID=1286976 RepID=R8BVN2_PHAM7|nr:putative dimethylaniline monooxygenase protein [Phaeoacremonium minimum UCRPA7]EOO03370.1 putative dimethylaniline monooxygenase protein [Phaeoacremonium minimum UCRPA7]